MQYRVFALADLHLPGADDKTMDIFGPLWENHPEVIRRHWINTVAPQDFVLCAGDISWAMNLAEVAGDLDWLGQLPGRIILSKGNHDYWWQSISQLRTALPPNVQAIQNDFVPLPGDLAVCGTRGWILPQSQDFSPETDEKIYQRELNRLQLSLDSAVRARRKIAFVMLHYPPFAGDGSPSGFTELLEAYRVPVCVYGHLHGHSIHSAVTGTVNGVTYHLTSADALRFTPKLVGSFSGT
ncbi:MAG: phosphohydrolase [Firmicutes bacterium]|nr:phosphohydrolase [Bacillota bacterium]